MPAAADYRRWLFSFSFFEGARMAQMRGKREYAVEVVTEGIFGGMILGGRKLPVKRMEAVMNAYADKGWKLTCMVIEQKRLFLVGNREAVVVTFERVVPG
jgi:hypothetical protein